uniref:Uncharacterized protein n=1 Tax=Rhizophora mucronata TaxID=61149 RepID=A0A2P2L1Z3_RHIMU
MYHRIIILEQILRSQGKKKKNKQAYRGYILVIFAQWPTTYSNRRTIN